MNQSYVKKIVYMSMFIALEVILTRFLSIQTPIVRVGFTFLPIAISSIMFGPMYSGTAAALADVIGMMIFSSGGSFFPGFTLSAFLAGFIYGMFLYKKTVSLIRISIAVIVTTIVVTIVLDTLWLWMITGQGIMAILPARLFKCIIMIPIQITMLQTMQRYMLGCLNSALNIVR